MAISKRLRFEILRRDNHACRYCGAAAPGAKLTVDHVVPVALGGADEPSNLVTACEPCNSGKSATPADAPIVDDVAADALRWANAMWQAASVQLADLGRRQADRDAFLTAWNAWTYPDSKTGKRETFELPRGWESSVDSIIAAGLPLQVLCECVDLVFGARWMPKDMFRYMCGIAWRKVSELQAIATALLEAEENGA